MDITTDDGKTVIAKVTAAYPHAAGCDQGVWVELQTSDGTKPTLCLVKDLPNGTFKGGWYLGVYRDTKHPGIACDLAISFDAKDGPTIQVVKGKEVRIVSLFDLLGLVGK